MVRGGTQVFFSMNYEYRGDEVALSRPRRHSARAGRAAPFHEMLLLLGTDAIYEIFFNSG